MDDDDEEEETTGAGAEEKAKALIARRLELYPHIAQFRSEGIFLQNVLPKFSLHHPLWPYGAKKVLYLLLKNLCPFAGKVAPASAEPARAGGVRVFQRHSSDRDEPARLLRARGPPPGAGTHSETSALKDIYSLKVL